jgi:hypothetical protein
MKSVQRRQAFSLSTNKPSSASAQSILIDGQWREVPAKPKAVRIPAVAWLVVASVGVFMGAIASVVTEHIATENAVWFMGGMIIGGMLSAVAVGVFAYLVYDTNREGDK